MTNHLYGLTVSPWTERARWALDHHRVTYRYHEHVPYLADGLLKFRARKTGRTPATVPLLQTPRQSLGDSLDILQFAETHGQGSPLLDMPDPVETWAARVEPLLQAGRALALGRTLNCSEALRESAQAACPAFLAGAFRPVAARGARFLAHKYRADLTAEDDHRRRLAEGLNDLQARKKDQLSFGHAFCAADILVATVLQFIRPPESFPLPPATRQCFTDPLADNFSDLLAWRDSVYATHRSSTRFASVPASPTAA